MSQPPPEIRTQVLEVLASSGTDSPVAAIPSKPREETTAAAVVPEGATPVPTDAAPPSFNPAPAVPDPAPAAPTGRVPEAANGSGSTSLEVIAANEPLEKWGTGGGVPWLAEYERMARLVAGTITLPNALKSPKDILAVALTGRELGIPFMESTRMVHIIQGTPALAAELKVKLARREGHDIRIVGESEGTCAVWCVTHESDQAIFTLEMARKAGLVKAGGGYEKFLPDMLWARAVTRLIRRHCPEVQGASLRSVEELEDAIRD